MSSTQVALASLMHVNNESLHIPADLKQLHVSSCLQAASAGVNRRKAADNINEENYAIFRRLQVCTDILAPPTLFCIGFTTEHCCCYRLSLSIQACFTDTFIFSATLFLLGRRATYSRDPYLVSEPIKLVSLLLM